MIIVITGCDRQSGESESLNYPYLQTPDSSSVNFIPGLAPPELQVYRTSTTAQQWAQIEPDYIDVIQAIAEFKEYLEYTDTTLNVVHVAMQQELQAWTDNPFYYLLAQVVANRMLWFHLLGSSAYSDEQRELIEYYVNIALRYHHPDAELFSHAIPILHQNNYWPTSRVKSAADSAYAWADNYLQVTIPSACRCEDSSGTTGYVHAAVDAQTVKIQLIQNRMPVLDSLANL